MSEMTFNPNTVPPMPDPYQPGTPDSAFASWAAAIAFLAGRTQLGSELAKVALRAKTFELRQGTTALLLTPQTPIFEQTPPPAVQPGPWIDPELSQAIPAYTEQLPVCPQCGEPHTPEDDHPVAVPPPAHTSRCQFAIEFHHGNETYTQPCDAPIYLGLDGVWHHLKPSGYHNATPRPEDNPAPADAS